MSKVKFSLKQQEMLRKAQILIDEKAIDYVDQLRHHIHSLKKSLGSNNLEAAIQTCHHMQGQAGTFGWPLATEIAGWFKRTLNLQQKSHMDKRTNEIFLASLEKMVKNNLRSHCIDALKLLQSIEAALAKKSTP